jgi:hypothetical protein
MYKDIELYGGYYKLFKNREKDRHCEYLSDKPEKNGDYIFGGRYWSL